MVTSMPLQLSSYLMADDKVTIDERAARAAVRNAMRSPRRPKVSPDLTLPEAISPSTLQDMFPLQAEGNQSQT